MSNKLLDENGLSTFAGLVKNAISSNSDIAIFDQYQSDTTTVANMFSAANAGKLIVLRMRQYDSTLGEYYPMLFVGMLYKSNLIRVFNYAPNTLNYKEIKSTDTYIGNSYHTVTVQKQLTAGDNISITNTGVISATDTTYTAGTGISIVNGVISLNIDTYDGEVS